MEAVPPPQSVDDYIASAAQGVRRVLEAVRATIREAAPSAEERISYRMPAFFLDGVLVYFAAFKNHIGFYPPVRDESLKPLSAKYAGPKGNLQFPLAEPIPHALIARIVKTRIRENRGRASSARQAKAGPGS